MAIINTTFGFAFVHVPKSAGTSVTSVLSKLCTLLDVEVGGSAFGEAIQSAYRNRHGISKHSTAQELRALLGEQLWLRYVSFGVVRHPLDRLASAYRFLRQWESSANRWHGRMSKFDTFADFVASDVWIKDEGPDRMFRPQAFWLAEQNNNKLLVDRVLHVESLNSDLRRLLLDIGVPRTKLPEALPHLNATRKLEVAYALPPELMAKVKERYHRDLDVFGYQIPAATAETVRGVASA
jgi:hypothetical protein